MSDLIARARAEQAARDKHSEELRASWLERSREAATRRWQGLLGDTRPEDWHPYVDNFEQDLLEIHVDGLRFRQHKAYKSGCHRVWLEIPRSTDHIECASHLADALDKRPGVVRWALFGTPGRASASWAAIISVALFATVAIAVNT